MTKSQVHQQAFGYELNAIKPVHFANGFFLAITGKHYRLEWLNKLAVVSHKKGLVGDYETPHLHATLSNEKNVLASAIDIEALGYLRKQANALVSNDDAVYAAFDDYSAFGNDYTISGTELLCSERLKDGFAGYFLYRIFSESDAGREALRISKDCFESGGDSLAALLGPILDEAESATEWVKSYEEKLGELTCARLAGIVALMDAPTSAVLLMLRNAQSIESRYVVLRQLVIALGVWLSVYLIREAGAAYLIREAGAAVGLALSPTLFCDFSGNKSRKCRGRSANCFSRHREMVYRSFEFWSESGRISSLDPFRNATTGQCDFKDVERHFSDLTVRVGLAQPRAATVRAKHYELQPDATRSLVMSLISKDEPPLTFPELALRLRTTWGISFGGCHDDAQYLASRGIIGLDEDDDLSLNRKCFIEQMKTLGLAYEPSDGLVLCGLDLGGMP